MGEIYCTATKCSIALTSENRQLTMDSPSGLRHAYECPCGAVTITQVRRVGQ